ncbi:MAG: hypothetical protein ACW977_08325, partial [Candidatus Thorarchaeota archaeon]
MKFYRTGELKENALEMMVEINPKEKAPRFVLKRLDYLIGLIHERFPAKVDAFTKNLERQYQDLVKSDYISNKSVDLSSVILELSNLTDYPSLANAAMNYYIQVLDLSDERAWDETINVADRNYHQAFLLPRYYNLLTLIDTLGREEAIKLWKRFFTQYIIDNRTPRERP